MDEKATEVNNYGREMMEGDCIFENTEKHVIGIFEIFELDRTLWRNLIRVTDPT